MKAWRLDGKDPLTARALVELYISVKALDKARGVATKLRKARSSHAMGPFLTALVLDRDGKHEEAYEAALAKDETFLDAHRNLAILCHTQNPSYRNEERTKKALKHYALYFELGGEDPELERVYQQFEGFMRSQNQGR